MKMVQHCCVGHVIGSLSGMPYAQYHCYQATSAAGKVVQPLARGIPHQANDNRGIMCFQSQSIALMMELGKILSGASEGECCW